MVADEELVLVGHVRRAHGVRGAVLVESLSDNPDRFAAGSRMWLREDAEATAAPATPDAPPDLDPDDALVVERCQEHSGALMVWFEGVADRDAADALRGADLVVPASEVPPPADGEWYEFQLVGCRVHDAEEGDLGTVSALVEDGGGLLLVVDDGLRRLPIPFVRDFLVEVDAEAQRIDVRLPPGLIEACASGS